mmetsp:Transcript_41832/g.125001  ORF Transcript_41832/g.125001 Transcript_41832/m.125001 type:complete len:330 (+) Transcript_41832:136-1125(+)
MSPCLQIRTRMGVCHAGRHRSAVRLPARSPHRLAGGKPADPPEQLRVEGVRGAVEGPQRNAGGAGGVDAALDRVVVANAVDPVTCKVQASAVVEQGQQLPRDDELEEREEVVGPGRLPLRPGRVDLQSLVLLTVDCEQQVAARVLEDLADLARDMVVRDEVEDVVRCPLEVRPERGCKVRVEGDARVSVANLRHHEGLQRPAVYNLCCHVGRAGQDDVPETTVLRAVCERQRPPPPTLLHGDHAALQPQLHPASGLHVRHGVSPHELAPGGVDLHLRDVVLEVREAPGAEVVQDGLRRLLVDAHLRDEEDGHGRVQAEPAEAVREAVVP